MEIVTRENLKTIMYAIYPKKLLQPQISQCIHLLYMTTMFESGDQIVPAYVHKKHEFTKLKESQCAHDQGPLVELHLLEGPYNSGHIFSLQGEL